MKKKFLAVAILFCSVFFSLAIQQDTYAYNTTGLAKKWVLTQYYACAKTGLVGTTLTAKTSGLIVNDVANKLSTDDNVNFPSYNLLGVDKTSCKKLFADGNGFKDVASYYGIKDLTWNSSNTVSSLKELGYTASENALERITITATRRTCFVPDVGFKSGACNSNGTVDMSAEASESSSVPISATKGSDGKYTYEVIGHISNALNDIRINIDNNNLTVKVQGDCKEPNSWSIPINANNPEAFYNSIEGTINNKSASCSLRVGNTGATIISNGSTTNYVYSFNSDSVVSSSSFYKYGNKDAAKKANRNLGGLGSNKIKLTNNQTYTLYYFYLTQAASGENSMTCNPTSTTNLTKVRLKDTDGNFKDCYVNLNGSKPEDIKVYIQSSSDASDYPTISQSNLKYVIKWMNEVDTSTLTDIPAVGESVLPGNNNSDDTGDDACFQGAGALGWIICPIVNALADALNNVYDWIEQNFLQVQSGSIFDRNNGVYEAWSMMQTFANIAFVIMILVVIFSQVTGVGIDNYGIKRILPRLIITAVLVNLSYIICQLAVDISNILGVSLRGLFDSFSAGVASAEVSTAQSAFSFGIVGIGFGVAIFMNPAIILTLLVSLLSCVIAALTLWVILMVRQVGVVLAVVLAPVAFVCYMLPNTQGLFKKWVDLGKGLLLVYPLASLLVGSASFLSQIFASVAESDGDNPAFALAAMLVKVLPFFALPTLFKQSLSAMGNLGATISGLGRAAGRGTTGAIRNSEGYKAMQGMGLERKNRIKAGMDKNGNLTGIGNLKSKLASSKLGRSIGYGRVQDSRIARAQKSRSADLDARESLQTAMSDYTEMSDPSAVSKSSFENQLQTAAKGTDADAYYALLNDATRRFGGSKAAEMHRKALMGAGSDGLMSSDRRAEFLRTANDRFGQKFGGKDFALSRYMQSGGFDANGNAVSVEDFENDSNNLKVGDISDSQATQLSANNIKRMMDAGVITQAMSQRIMSDPSLRGNMDDVQQLMFAHHAAGNGPALSKDDAENSLAGKSSYTYTARDGSQQTANTTYTQQQATELIKPRPQEVNLSSTAGVATGSGLTGSTTTSTSTPSSGDMSEDQDINIQNPTPEPSRPVTQPRIPSSRSSSLDTRANSGQVAPDGTINIQGEGSFEQTDSGIIIPRR